jgi:DNA-binding response OmpR family regulator
MVSAVHELECVARRIDLGATDYLPKPFSAAVLRARLRVAGRETAARGGARPLLPDGRRGDGVRVRAA